MGSAQPLVSVIIPTRNRRAWVSEAVRSALAQTYQSVEVLLVENGSAEVTEADRIGWGRRVRYERLDVPSLSQARNAGIAAARGDFLALLDDDDLWCPEKLEHQMPFFDDPSVQVVYGDAHLFREPGVSQGLYSRFYTPRRGDVLLDLLLHPFAVCSTLIFRRDAVSSSGGFDPNFEIAEELDLLLRVAPTGRFAYVERPIAWYRLHDGNDSRRCVRLWTEVQALIERTLGRHPDLVAQAPRACRLRQAESDFHLGVALFQEGRWGAGFRAWTASRSRPAAFVEASFREMGAWVRRRCRKIR